MCSQIAIDPQIAPRHYIATAVQRNPQVSPSTPSVFDCRRTICRCLIFVIGIRFPSHITVVLAKVLVLYVRIGRNVNGNCYGVQMRSPISGQMEEEKNENTHCSKQDSWLGTAAERHRVTNF
jgi:hypothetical protein